MLKVSQADIDAFADEYRWMRVPAQARGQCVSASMTFLKSLGVPVEEMHRYMARSGTNEFDEHHWVKVGDLNIDFTARQFDRKAPFPKVWRQS